MLKEITIGQFFPGNSLLHRLDARTKIILSILYLVLVFLANTMESFVIVTLLTLILIFVSQIPLKLILRSMKPLIFIVVFMLIFHIFSHPTGTKLVEFWRLSIWTGGIYYAIFISLRIILLLCGTCVILTYTTSPIALADAIERLLYPLTWIKIPVHDFAMMMTIALRFIPTLLEETDKIISAQKARGADMESGNVFRRAKALIPVLIPLFISSFRRAEELAIAMECRCYRGGKGRTRMTTTHFAFRDYFCFVLFGALLAGIILLQKYFFLWKVL